MLIWSPYAHKCTIWVSIQIAFSILNLLKQENTWQIRLYSTHSAYLVLFREAHPSQKNYHSPVTHEHTFYRHGFLLCTIGPPEQTVNSAGYMETYSELISVWSRWYFLYFCIFSMDLYVSILVFQDQTSRYYYFNSQIGIAILKGSFYCTAEEGNVYPWSQLVLQQHKMPAR